MNAWHRSVRDRAFNLGLSMGDLTRRVHGASENRPMVELALALEAAVERKPDPDMAARSRRLFRGKR